MAATDVKRSNPLAILAVLGANIANTEIFSTTLLLRKIGSGHHIILSY